MRIHFSQNHFGRGLEIYFISDDGTRQYIIDEIDGRGVMQVSEHSIPDGTVVEPSLVLGYPYAEAFEEGFKRFLGERTHIVPEKVYEREAARVDKLLDHLTKEH